MVDLMACLVFPGVSCGLGAYDLPCFIIMGYSSNGSADGSHKVLYKCLTSAGSSRKTDRRTCCFDP